MTKALGFSVGLAAAAGLFGCYNTTNVKNGGLACGANDVCPDGFRCVKDGLAGQSGHCWREGTGPDAAGTVGPDTGAPKADVANPLACTVASGPFGPFSPCTADPAVANSTCDPICQSGCPCRRRCVLNQDTWASFLCESTEPDASTFVPVQGDCTNQVEACAPGAVCVYDDVCPSLCFRLCRRQEDCPTGTLCSAAAIYDKSSTEVPTVKLCTPPTQACNPTGTADCNPTRGNFKCVFLAGMTGVQNTDATVCDCASTHTKKLGATDCSMAPDDCQAGTVCVDGTCRQICDRQASGQSCASGGCNPLYASTRYGYCR
jgi:hypothetical protein